MSLGREPVEIVEIDMPVCTRVYGSAPCAAVLGTTGARKCFNTLKTCQDEANYAETMLTLRFAKNQRGMPDDVDFFPALSGVSSRPGRVNLSGIDPKRSPLGQRARITVTLQDFTWQDTLTDPYQAQRVSGAAQADGIGYDPKSRGTFFTRMRARWPYYLGLPLRHKTGYRGEALGAMRTSHYVVTEWSGPDADGLVTITAKDILELADNDKALAPSPSRGKLLAAISTASASLTLTPATVGAEYATSGLVSVGRELMRYSRSGDVMTLTGRGVAGTVVSSHSAGDVVQEALEYANVPADVIISDLLTTFAGVPPGFIPSAAWQSEVQRWLGGSNLSAIIVKPEGVAGLVGEICQHGITCWWDEIDQEMKLTVNKPLDIGQSYYPVTDETAIIERTAEVSDSVDERASQVLFWHGIVDPTDSATNSRNYRDLYIAGVVPNRYGEERVKAIYSRWFGSAGDAANASVIADRLLSRYRDIPIILKCDLDAKDRDHVPLTAMIGVLTRQITDDTGATVTYPMQVLYREETIPGTRISIEAQTFTFDGRFGFYMQAGDPSYDAATDTDKAEGCFYVDGSIGHLSGDEPYTYF